MVLIPIAAVQEWVATEYLIRKRRQAMLIKVKIDVKKKKG